MADSEEDLHSDDSDISDYSEATSVTSVLSNSDQDEEDNDIFNLSQGYVTSETMSLQSSQQQWQHDNRKPTFKEQIQFRKLTHYTNSLLENLKQKQIDVEQARESLNMCRAGIATMEEVCSRIKEDIKLAKERNNISSFGLLEGKMMKRMKELEAERLKEANLEQKLRDNELILAECEMKAGQCEDIRQEIEETEQTIKQYKQKKVMFRTQGETRQLIEAQRSEQVQNKMKKGSDNKKERMKASQARKDGLKIVNDAMKRRKEREAVEERERNINTENRMKALLNLKKSVTESRDALKAKHLLEKERQQKLKEIEEGIKLKAVKAGNNPKESLLRSKKIEQYENEKREFNKKQQQRQLSIVSKLVEEEKIQKKEDKRSQLSHWQYQFDDTACTSLQSIKKTLKASGKPTLQLQTGDVPIVCVKSDGGVESDGRANEEGADIEDTNSAGNDEGIILEPDIPGLWENKHANAIPSSTKMSKMEKDILEKTLNKLQTNVIIKQIAAGKEFKGQAFISKPAEIVFKDFEIGKTYTKRVQLTNVSYTVNYCKLIGVSDDLKDFIDIDFNPFGSISAGLTCHMTVHFQPKINDDLSGNIELLSQTGPIYIPLKCYTKTCMISVDNDAILFGSVCVGETVKRILTVHNEGALPTRYTIAPINSALTSEQLLELSVQDAQSLTMKHSGCTSRLKDISHVSMLSAVELKQNEGLLKYDHLNDLQSRSTIDINNYNDSKPLDIAPISSRPQTKNESLKETSTKTVNSSHHSDNDQLLKVGVAEDKSQQLDREAGKTEEVEGDEELTVSQSIEPLAVTSAKCIKIEQLSSDVIEGYSTLKIELSFSPKLPGDYELDFKLDCFQSILKQPIIITATGKAIAVPVYVEKEILDLKICLTDMMYQDSIVLHNRSVTPHNLTFVIPEPVNRYLEILPQYGLIQGESSFAAQLKLLPTKDLFDTQYIDNDSGILRVPIDINIMDQTDTVSFLVKACISVSDVAISPTTIDYGTCTVCESLVCTVDITNSSCLPMDFGFIQLPKWITVQPNEGFGTLLPHETFPIDVIFSPERPNTYSTKLTCKTAINKNVHLAVKGTGILPGLSLSHSDISFAATPYGTSSTVRLAILNPRLSRMDSAVIRGGAPPSGTKMFEFRVPDQVPVIISPHTGSVDTGKSVEVSVTFSPVISSELITKEAATLFQEAEKEKEKKEETETIAVDQKSQTRASSSTKGSLKSGSKGSVGSSNNMVSVRVSQTISTEERSQTDPPKERSEWWWKGYNQLLYKSENECRQWSIPCYISYGTQSSARVEETLYVCITAAAIRPSLVIVSDDGSNIVDFKTVAIGDQSCKTVLLKNMSPNTLNLSSSPLSSDGTFEIRNALKPVPCNGSHSMIVRFAPCASGKWYETVKIYYNHSLYMELTLKGEGVDPDIKINPNHEPLDYGHVMSGDKCIETVELQNTSKLGVRYSITLDSSKHDQKYVKNCNGQCPFNCVPFKGLLLPESSVEAVVEFSPDHPGKCYSDKLHIDINSKVIQTIDLSGCAWPSNMYILGGAETQSIISSMEAQPSPVIAPPVILLMTHNTGSNSSSVEFEIGCIKTGLVKKANGEFVIETLQGSSPKSFTVDPIKSSVEAGVTKPITITFTAPQQIKDKVIEVNSYINLKGDTTSRHQLFIRVTITE